MFQGARGIQGHGTSLLLCKSCPSMDFLISWILQFLPKLTCLSYSIFILSQISTEDPLGTAVLKVWLNLNCLLTNSRSVTSSIQTKIIWLLERHCCTRGQLNSLLKVQEIDPAGYLMSPESANAVTLLNGMASWAHSVRPGNQSGFSLISNVWWSTLKTTGYIGDPCAL